MVKSSVVILLATFFAIELVVLPLTSGLPVKGLKDVLTGDHQEGAGQPVPAKNGDLNFQPEGQKLAANIDEMEKLKETLKGIENKEKLPVEKLKPVDHMDGVKMEQDGHVNKEYHKEMFLGGHHDEFNQEMFDETDDKLKEIVNKADTDKDGDLSKEEMESWILANMKEHFQHAEEENDHIFKHLDPDGDGFVTWKEYYVHFLLSRGFEMETAVKHVKDYDNSMGETDDLLLADKDMLMTYKFKWTDADKEPIDNKLSKDEFMVFRHPEHCKASLNLMAENVLRTVDTNNDGMISMEEFSALPAGEVEGKEFEAMDKKWQAERRKEFQEIMDINKDGLVTSEELKRYLDPTNPIQAKIEAGSLINLMDDDQNGRLSMKEILDHSEIFITSKLANFGANVHEEL